MAPALLLLALLRGVSAASEPKAYVVESQIVQAPKGSKELFEASGCLSCHSVRGRGGNTGPDLSYAGFRHSRDWLELWLEDPTAWKADTRMPRFRLKPGTRKALAGYLASLQGPAAGRLWTEPESDPLRLGRQVYLKAGCAACHGPQGHGGQPNNNVVGRLIPNLDQVYLTFKPDELKLKISRGSRPAKEDPAGPDPLVRMPAWGEKLSAAEIDAVAAYLFTLRPEFGKGKDLDW